MYLPDTHLDLLSDLEACLPTQRTIAVSLASLHFLCALADHCPSQFCLCSVSNRSKTQDGEISISKATLRHSDNSAASNTISILLIAQWRAYSLEILVSWVDSRQVLCLLEWSLPEFPSLVFTTRHSLVVEEPYGVRFDGGLGWANTTSEHFQLLGLLEAGSVSAHLPRCQYPELALVHQPSPPCFSNPYPESAGPSPHRSRSGSSERATFRLPLTPPHDGSHDTWWLVPHPQTFYMDSSLYPYPAEGSDDGTPQPDSPEPLTHDLPSACTSRPPTPSEDDVPICYFDERTEEDIPHQYIQDHEIQNQDIQNIQDLQDENNEQYVQNQIFIEFLGHRQREAEDLFRRTGDPSGLLAVSRAAITAGEGVWRPSGLSYF